jgi:hypothetical protein
MPGYNSQRRGRARTFQFFFIVTCMYVPLSVFRVLCVCKCVLHCCHRASTQLQLKIHNNKLCVFSCKKIHISVALQTINSYERRPTSLVSYGYPMTCSVLLAQGLTHIHGRLMCLHDSTKSTRTIAWLLL